MNYTDLTEREKEFLAIIRTMTDEQRDECLSDLQKIGHLTNRVESTRISRCEQKFINVERGR